MKKVFGAHVWRSMPSAVMKDTCLTVYIVQLGHDWIFESGQSQSCTPGWQGAGSASPGQGSGKPPGRSTAAQERAPHPGPPAIARPCPRQCPHRPADQPNADPGPRPRPLAHRERVATRRPSPCHVRRWAEDWLHVPLLAQAVPHNGKKKRDF